MESKQWTPEKVRALLPNVKVMYEGKERTAHTAGRMNRFATVSFGHHRFTFSWSAIVYSLNHDEALQL